MQLIENTYKPKNILAVGLSSNEIAFMTTWYFKTCSLVIADVDPAPLKQWQWMRNNRPVNLS
jgi:hypothetical protein